MRFDHERIPERVVHARGAGAHGYFRLKKPIPDYTFAPVLNETSRTTPVFIRFSTVQVSTQLSPPMCDPEETRRAPEDPPTPFETSGDLQLNFIRRRVTGT